MHIDLSATLKSEYALLPTYVVYGNAQPDTALCLMSNADTAATLQPGLEVVFEHVLHASFVSFLPSLLCCVVNDNHMDVYLD